MEENTYNKIERCQNCIFWKQESAKYGKCSKIMIDFCYSTVNEKQQNVQVLTPRYGICKKYKNKLTEF